MEWTDKSVIDFVNWYIDLHQLGVRYKLENTTIIDSFKHGDAVEAWDNTFLTLECTAPTPCVDEAEALRQEMEEFKLTCGSCTHFACYMTTAGFCKLAECNCIRLNPKAMIDMFDDKCEKWELNPEYATEI